MTLKTLNDEIAATYESMVSTIEELLVLMNERRGEKKEIERKARLILPFLRKLKASIDSEQNMVNVTIRRNEPFSLSLETLLEKIANLQAFIQLASKGNKEAKVIKGINILNKAILKELEKQRGIVLRAAA